MATYYEFIIKGDDGKVRPYLEGFFRGKGVRKGYGFGEDHPLDLGGLKELIKYHGSVQHVICRAGLRATVESALRQAPEGYRMEAVETHRVRRAYFHFKFRTANRKVAGQIKRMAGQLPGGVRLTDYHPEEVVDPSAHGSEGYAPVHEYTFSGNGVVEGDAQGVFDVYRRMREHEFVEVDKIVLHRG